MPAHGQGRGAQAPEGFHGVAGKHLAVLLQATDPADEGAVLQPLHHNGVRGGGQGPQPGPGHPPEVLAEEVPVGHVELDLVGLLPRDLPQDGALAGGGGHDRPGPEESQALGADVAHQSQDHQQGEPQGGPGEPDQGAAPAPPFADVHHHRDS